MEEKMIIFVTNTKKDFMLLFEGNIKNLSTQMMFKQVDQNFSWYSITQRMDDLKNDGKERGLTTWSSAWSWQRPHTRSALTGSMLFAFLIAEVAEYTTRYGWSTAWGGKKQEIREHKFPLETQNIFRNLGWIWRDNQQDYRERSKEITIHRA